MSEERQSEQVSSGDPGTLDELRQCIEDLERELEESRRLAIVGSTMRGLAHSIRSALGLCRAATHMVDRALALEDLAKIERAWQMVKRSSSRTAELTAALLDPEEAGRLKPVPGDPNSLIGEVCEVAIEQARDQGDALICELESELDGVRYDRQALHRICVELLSNSLDALAEAPGKGRVVVRTERFDDGWELTVLDTGPGMTDERLQRVLGGGYSTKGKGGSGLGVLQVRQLVRAHGGTVTFTTEPGKGTAVRCFFPFTPQITSDNEEERDAS